MGLFNVADDEKAYLREALERGETSPCLVCGNARPAADLLHVPNCGAVCFTCVAAIKVAAGRDWEFREE